MIQQLPHMSFCFHLWCENCFVVQCTTKAFPHQLCLRLHHTQDPTISPHPPPALPISSLWRLGCWGTPSGGLPHWLSPAIQAARSLFLDHGMSSWISFIRNSSFSHPSCQLPLAAWVLKNLVWLSSSLVISSDRGCEVQVFWAHWACPKKLSINDTFYLSC